MRESLLEYIHTNLRVLCVAAIKKSFGVASVSKKLFDAIPIETPPDEKMGDLAFPCFALAKELKKSPAHIASDVAGAIKKLPPEVERVQAVGPYVNFFLNPAVIAVDVLKTLKMGSGTHSLPKLSQTPLSKGKIVIEYVSPNTNKPLHIGHARNAFLGESIARIYEHFGHTIVRACLVNDRGIHICKSMVAYQQQNQESRIKNQALPTPQNTGKKGDHFVGDYYVLYNTLLEKHPEIENRAKECLQKLEAGDVQTRALWKKMNGWVFAGMTETYKRLGISFDTTYLESEMYTKGKDIIMKGLSKGTFKKDETGAVYADLSSFNLPNKILLRKDGTAIYITQDVYLAFKKWKEYKPTASLYVVASEQDMYFKQFFAVLALLKIPYAKHLAHVSYGMVRLPEGKMKSREGTVVDADDLLDELVALAKKELEKRQLDPGLCRDDKENSESEIKKRSEAIALAALKYYLLAVGPESDMIFNPKESIALQGKTGPYILYTYARLKSIARKAGKGKNSRIPASAGMTDGYNFFAEKPLVVALLYFKDTIEKATASCNPSLLANYLWDLAKKTNDYYHGTPVLKSSEPARSARLLLIAKIADTLKTGLSLLGIETIEKM